MMDASGNVKAVAVLTGKGAAMPENMRFYQKRAEQYPDIYMKAGDMYVSTYHRLSYQKFHYVIFRSVGRTAMGCCRY